MASPAELSGDGELKSPYSAEVETRSYKLADYYAGERVTEWATAFRKVTANHPALVPDVTVMKRAIAEEKKKAVEESLRKREVGLLNDTVSAAPGIFITGILDYRKIEVLKGLLEESRMLKPEHAAESEFWVEDFDEISDMNTLRYKLHLPEGFYMVAEYVSFDPIMISTKCRMYESGGTEATGMRLGGILFGGYHDPQNQNVVGVVGRIEGAGGTLWQNPDSMPDGSPKVQIEAVV